jgi:hypothetical protein
MSDRSMKEQIAARTNVDADKSGWRNSKWAAVFRFSAAKMLIALVLFICSAPFVDRYKHGAIISTLLMTAVLITATLAMGGRRWTLAIATVIAIPALAARWSTHLRPDLMPPEVFSAIGLLFIGFVATNIISYILRAPQVSSEVLCAGVSGYLLLGLVWAFAYTLVGSASADAFAFAARPGAPRWQGSRPPTSVTSPSPLSGMVTSCPFRPWRECSP